MLDLNQQISEARQALNTEIGNAIKGIQESYVAALAKEQSLQAEAEKQQQAALNLRQVGVEYAVLEEEVKVNRDLYQSILGRLHSTSISNDLAFSNMQILQGAERPNYPSDPNNFRDLSLSTLLGLFLGLGLIFALEYLDSAVSTPEHVWRTVALSTFGTVPDLNSLKPLLDYKRLPGVRQLTRRPSLQVPSRFYDPGKLISEHHPLSLLTESYRTIRTSLLYSQAGNPPQVTLLTSASPGEGKTVTTLNLSVVLAQDGYKVLVIDADLRKGQCHTRLNLKNHKGLSDILTGNIALQDGIQETSVSGLSVITRGTCPPNPSDLLGSRKMREVLASLRESFHFIIIDSPPAIVVSDARILSVNSDAVILVFHAQKTTRAAARRIVEHLETVRAPIVGTILNCVDLKNPDYTYYRTYYGSDYGVGGYESTKTASNGNYSDSDNMTTVAEPESAEMKLSSIESSSDLVSRKFFDKMIGKLSEAVGPMAPLILSDQIVRLGESLEAFPKSRVKELFESISQEILSNDMRDKFNEVIAQELQSL